MRMGWFCVRNPRAFCKASSGDTGLADAVSVVLQAIANIRISFSSDFGFLVHVSQNDVDEVGHVGDVDIPVMVDVGFFHVITKIESRKV